MCELAVSEEACDIKYVPDWFVTTEMVDKYKGKEWVEAYKQRKAQKAKIKEELLPVA